MTTERTTAHETLEELSVDLTDGSPLATRVWHWRIYNRERRRSDARLAEALRIRDGE